MPCLSASAVDAGARGGRETEEVTEGMFTYAAVTEGGRPRRLHIEVCPRSKGSHHASRASGGDGHYKPEGAASASSQIESQTFPRLSMLRGTRAF